MSDTSAQEPTMEEILASIRRIISEDDAPQPAEAAPAQASPSPAASPQVTPPQSVAPAVAPPVPASEPPRRVEPEPVPAAPAIEDDILELNEPIDPPRYEETLGDLDVFKPSPSLPPPSPRPAPAPSFTEEPLVGSYAAEQTAGHFTALARSLTMPKEGRTLEDVVREMLRPMLRDWLDQNLPAIVEARVQAEVERISRRGDY